jgi:hypothetical protein
MQLRPIAPVALPAAGTALDILPVDLDHDRGTITRVRLFVNNTAAAPHNVTVTVAGGAPIVVAVAALATLLVLDDIPVQQPDSTSSNVQITASGNDGAGGAAFVAFGSFVVT